MKAYAIIHAKDGLFDEYRGYESIEKLQKVIIGSKETAMKEAEKAAIELAEGRYVEKRTYDDFTYFEWQDLDLDFKHQMFIREVEIEIKNLGAGIIIN